MNKEHIKSLTREELENEYIDALSFIASKMMYVEYIQWDKRPKRLFSLELEKALLSANSTEGRDGS